MLNTGSLGKVGVCGIAESSIVEESKRVGHWGEIEEV